MLTCAVAFRYPVTLSYLKATRGEPMPHAEANEDGRGLRSHFVGADFEDDSKWEKVDGDFLNFLALNTEWLSSSFKAGAYTSLNDGYMDLVWIMRGVRTGEVLDVLLDEGSSNWVKKPYVKFVPSHCQTPRSLLIRTNMYPGTRRHEPSKLNQKVTRGFCQMMVNCWSTPRHSLRYTLKRSL